MERRVEQFLPYFSIGINVLLCWWILDSASGTIAHGSKYASAILQLIERVL